MLLLLDRVAVAVLAWHGRADLPPPARPAREIRRVARRVLARPEYHRHDPDLVARVRQAVSDFVARLLADALRGPTVIGVALFALLLAAVIVVSVRVGRGITAEGAERIVATGIARRTAAEWRAEAEGRERDGDWRGAVRCRYRALVAELAERGLVDEVPGRTAGEYRREVAGAAPDAAADFAGATELFELAWYGHGETDAAAAARFGSLADRVLTGART